MQKIYRLTRWHDWTPATKLWLQSNRKHYETTLTWSHPPFIRNVYFLPPKGVGGHSETTCCMGRQNRSKEDSGGLFLLLWSHNLVASGIATDITGYSYRWWPTSTICYNYGKMLQNIILILVVFRSLPWCECMWHVEWFEMTECVLNPLHTLVWQVSCIWSSGQTMNLHYSQTLIIPNFWDLGNLLLFLRRTMFCGSFPWACFLKLIHGRSHGRTGGPISMGIHFFFQERFCWSGWNLRLPDRMSSKLLF